MNDEKPQKLAEIFLDYLNAQEASCVNARKQLTELFGGSEPATSEAVFNALRFESHKGEKLAEFETADKQGNVEQNWTHAFNILKASNSTINNRYHGADFTHTYWLYQDRIFRQKLKQA